MLSVDERERRVLAVAPGVGLREFAFDAVFGETATQAAVYERSARPLVADFVNGFNGAMLVYGQTGSGKTHTMFGCFVTVFVASSRRSSGPRRSGSCLARARAP